MSALVDRRPAAAPPPGRPVFRASSAVRRLPPGWPVYALFFGYPVWWALGLQAFIWPLLAVPMALVLFRRNRVVLPRGGGWFLLFLLWMLASAVQLDSARQALAFAYRGGLYLSAFILLLYVVNLGPQRIPTRRLVQCLVALWATTVVGGLAALALPPLDFRSITELLLPASVAADPFVRSLVHPELSSVSTLLGYELPRPKAPFNYTNEWGANLALLTPVAVYAFRVLPSRRWRAAIAALLAASLLPGIVSINRGLWISVAVALLYVAVRAAGRGRVQMLAGVVLGAAALLVVVLSTPLAGIVTTRAERSNLEGRTYLYEESVRSALQSPLLGHGAPIASDAPGLTAGASVGTHGQLWTLLVSQGIPGLVLFVGFLVASVLLTWRVGRWALWLHAVPVVALVQLPFYNALPVQLHVVMLVLALSWRAVRDTRPSRAGSSSPVGVPAT